MATKRIVPRANGEGEIGSSIKRWLKGWFTELFCSGNLTDGTNTATIANLKDAVDKKHSNTLDHTKNEDQYLDYGGANQIPVEAIPWQVFWGNTILEVNPDTGSDETGDGSAGNPYRTIQYIINFIPPLLRNTIYTINLQDSLNYNEEINISSKIAGAIVIQGKNGDATKALITKNQHILNINACQARVVIKAISLRVTANNKKCISLTKNSNSVYVDNVLFGDNDNTGTRGIMAIENSKAVAVNCSDIDGNKVDVGLYAKMSIIQSNSSLFGDTNTIGEAGGLITLGEPIIDQTDYEDAVVKKHTQNTDTGTTSQTFQLQTGSSGAKIKNNAGVLECRNSADDAYAVLQALGLIAGYLKPASDSTTAIQLQKADGTNILNVDTTNSRVGILNNAPNYALDVIGTIRGDVLQINHNSATITFGSASLGTILFSIGVGAGNTRLGNCGSPGSNETSIGAGGVQVLSVKSTALVINETGADIDTRIEGDTNANLLYIDAGADRIGIGTASPQSTLDVAGKIANSIASDTDFDTDEILETGIGASYGLLIVRELTSGITGVYRVENQTLVLISANALFNTAKDNSNTYNVYWETDPGSGYDPGIYIQNKVGDNKNIKVGFYGL